MEVVHSSTMAVNTKQHMTEHQKIPRVSLIKVDVVEAADVKNISQ